MEQVLIDPSQLLKSSILELIESGIEADLRISNASIQDVALCMQRFGGDVSFTTVEGWKPSGYGILQSYDRYLMDLTIKSGETQVVLVHEFKKRMFWEIQKQEACQGTSFAFYVNPTPVTIVDNSYFVIS